MTSTTDGPPPSDTNATSAPATASATAATEDAFLSYSRRDTERTLPLLHALVARGRSISFDQEDIHGAEQWRARLKSLIERAQNLIFAISPASLASVECRWELDLATSLNKRIVPLLLVAVDPADLPESLRAIQWIDATSTDSLSRVVDRIIEALETDQEWAEYHTRLALRAQECSAGRGSLLSTGEVRTAESMMLRFLGKRPFPTGAQTTYLIASRKAILRRRLVTAAVALIAVVGLGTVAVGWFIEQRNADYLALQRQGDQALNQLGGGDLAAGVASLGYVIAHDTQGLLQRYATLLEFWLPRLVSLDDLKHAIAVGDVVQWRGQTYVKLDTGALAQLPVGEPFRAGVGADRREALFAHVAGVTLVELHNALPLVEIQFAGGRVRPDELYAAPAASAFVAVGRRTVMTNDEDQPEEIHGCFAVVLAANDTPYADCNGAASDTPAAALDEWRVRSAAGKEGWRAYTFCGGGPFTVRRIEAPANGVLNIDGTGPAPTRIALDSRACRVDVTEIPPQALERPSEHRPLDTHLHAFPQRRDESQFWASARTAARGAASSAAADANPAIVDLLSGGDFTQLPDGEEVRRQIENNDAIAHGSFSKGAARYAWFAYVSGNSFQTILSCEVTPPNRIVRCSRAELGVIRALSPSSPNRRWIAYAPCNSAEGALSFFDVTSLDRKPALPAGSLPVHTVLDVTFDSSSNRAAALTESDELYIFDLGGDELRSLRKVELTGGAGGPRPVARREATVAEQVSDLCGERTGGKVAFVGERTVVGLTADRELFAVNTETGDVLWRRAPSVLSEAGTVRLSVGGRRDLALVRVGTTVQLVDTATGVPLSDVIDPDQRVPQPEARPEIESVDLASDGSLELTLSDGTRLRRQPPLSDAALRQALRTIERATGISATDGRSALQHLPP